jgi:hypothetical protein
MLPSIEAIITCVHGMATFYTHFWSVEWGTIFTEMAGYIHNRIDKFNELQDVSHLERAILEPLANLSTDIRTHSAAQFSPTQYREQVDTGIRQTLAAWDYQTEIHYNHVTKNQPRPITPTTSDNVTQRLKSSAVKGLHPDLCPMTPKLKRATTTYEKDDDEEEEEDAEPKPKKSKKKRSKATPAPSQALPPTGNSPKPAAPTVNPTPPASIQSDEYKNKQLCMRSLLHSVSSTYHDCTDTRCTRTHMDNLPTGYKTAYALNNVKRLRNMKDIPESAQAEVEAWIKSKESPFSN